MTCLVNGMGSLETKKIWHTIVLFVRNFLGNFDANIIASYVPAGTAEHVSTFYYELKPLCVCRLSVTAVLATHAIYTIGSTAVPIQSSRSNAKNYVPQGLR